MTFTNTTPKRIIRDIIISLFIYALPVVALILWFHYTGEKPWITNGPASPAKTPAVFNFIRPVFTHLRSWGFIAIAIVLGIAEFALGLYDNKWTKKERIVDIVCFVAPKVLLAPVTAFFALKFLPFVLPHLDNAFSWVPFWGGVFLIAVGDDLTQY